MAAGIKILSAMMSLLIVSITEITPWVFANADASDNSVILDAACFDSVIGINTDKLFAGEIISVAETSVPEIAEPATEILAEETTFVFAEPVTEEVSQIAEETVVEEPVSDDDGETTEEPEETTIASEEEEEEIVCDEMLWPVARKSEVVAGFPAYDSGRTHHGVDIFVIGNDGRTRDDNGNSLSYGVAFRAAKDGVVVEVRNDGGWNSGFGNYCIVDHGDGTQTLYAHAKSVCVKLGQNVSQGETLGEIGGTGNTTAPHLHFEVRIGNVNNYTRVNPLNYINEP